MPFSLVKMFCFSSPQPRLNNRRAINYIPNWIPICLFAMYVSKTFYLLSRFKVPQDPSVLRKNIYFCPSCNSYLPSTEFQLSSSSWWVTLEINFIIVFFFSFFFDKELSSRKFKLNVFKSDYYTQFTVYLFRFWKCFIKYILFFHIPHSGHQSFKVLFRPNGNSTWLSYFPPLILFIISTQKLDCEQSLIFLLSHSGPITQSTREGRGTRMI